jgi:hypothetical protein
MTTYVPELDFNRLSTQLEKVRQLMSDGEWRTLGEISAKAQGSEASVSARLREIRKNGRTVERRRKGDPRSGLFEYRVS